MKRSLYLILYITAFALALTACSENEDLASDSNPVKVSKITISPYPAFAENAGTRSNGVGTFDAGKTVWEAGDEILLVVAGNLGLAAQNITLTYNGTEWVPDKPIYWLVSRTLGLAYYAPDWTFPQTPSVDPELKEGAKYGTSEYLYVYSPMLTGEGDITIDFSGTPRYYSRLRIAGEPSSKVDVTITNFEPCTLGEYKEYHYTLDTDEKGNAYLYGSWDADATLTIKGNFDVNGTGKEMTLFDKTISTASEDNKGYVADARLSYKNEGDGTAENPYKISLPVQLASLAEAVNNGTFADVEGGIHVALESDIDLSDYPDWTPIGRSNTHPFVGTFDGQGHTISGLTINNSNPDEEKDWGLFGMVQDATIKNVRVDGNITLSNFGDRDSGAENDLDGIGCIAGRCSGAANNFYGCHSNVTIEGTGNSCWAGVGGIVGFVKEGKTTFVACGSTGKVIMKSQATEQIRTGGLIGALRMTEYFTVHACYCNGEIHSVYNGTERSTGALFSDFQSVVSNSTNYVLMDAFYWSKVNGKPDVLVRGISGLPETGTTLIESTEWQTAMTNMNEYLSTNYPNFGYEYVENTGADAANVPLILQPVQ